MTFAQMFPWWRDALRLRVGLLKRPQPQVPHIPKGSPEQAELDRFATWVLWKAAGAKPPRPAGLWKRVPDRVYWTVLGEYLKKHPPPHVDPPPQPKPPAPKPAPSWTLTNGPWIYVESDPGTVPAGPWTRLDIQENAVAPGAPLWTCPKGRVPQMEGGNQATACLEYCKQVEHGVDIAPVTTLGIDPAPYLAIGVTSVMVECYLQGQANALDKLWYATNVEGWPDAIPVIGVGWTDKNGTYGFKDYAGWLTQLGVGSRFGVYASDAMSATDWADLRSHLG